MAMLADDAARTPAPGRAHHGRETVAGARLMSTQGFDGWGASKWMSVGGRGPVGDDPAAAPDLCRADTAVVN
jgi:hypothetical protein